MRPLLPWARHIHRLHTRSDDTTRREIAIVDMEVTDRERLAQVLRRCGGGHVIDTRPMPGFDECAGSRHAAFELFRRAGARYVDLFAELRIASYRSPDARPGVWGNRMEQILAMSHRTGTVAVLVQGRARARECARVFAHRGFVRVNIAPPARGQAVKGSQT